MNLQLRNSAIRCLWLTSIITAPAFASNYAYLSEGETGEPSFSDEASPDARRIELAAPTSPSLSSAEQIEQMLSVAEVLAAARQDREAARASARSRAQQSTPAVTPEPEYRYRSSYFRGPYRRYNSYYNNSRNRSYSNRSRSQEPVEPSSSQSKSFRYKPN